MTRCAIQVTNVRDTFYCIGTVVEPPPCPAMVRDFQSIIGKEVRWQLAEQEGDGRLPRYAGGSDRGWVQRDGAVLSLPG